MSIKAQREAVHAAEAQVVLAHRETRQHLVAFGAARDALLTPGRIIVTGLAVGFIAGKAVPALRKSEVRRDFDRGTDALQRVLALVRSAMPLLMPVWAAVSARRAQQATEAAELATAPAAAAGADGQATTLH
jgi:hypothetical protein